MLRLGVIDLGTNSTRLLIADANGGGVHPLVKRAITTRLGLMLDKTGIICDESIEKTIEAIKEYKCLMETYGVDESFAIATSAVRSSGNRDEVTKRISEETGLDIIVLTGEEEARLGYLGVKTQYGDETPLLVVDIGGGSTEFILCHQGNILYKKSIPLGCVRLTEKFITSYPVSHGVIENIKEFALKSLGETLGEIKNISRDFRVIAIGGTSTTLSALVNGIERIENSTLSLENINNMIEDFGNRDIESLRSIDLIEEGRHDVILSGALELLCIMEELDVFEAFITLRDSLEGVVLFKTSYI